MARYIDADKMVAKDNAYTTFPHDLAGCDDSDLVRWINEQPTADVVAVVRCKDCKYNAFAQPNGTIHCHARKNLSCEYRKADDFCSYGERRE